MISNNPVKAVIFDMDGVLSDSMPAHATAWQKTFQEANINIELQDIYLIEGSNHRGIVRAIFAQHNKEYTEDVAKKLSLRKIRIFNSLYEPSLFNNVKPLLDKLKNNNFKLAVVSGSNKSTVQDIITHCFKSNTFDTIITGDDVIQGKPAPDAYLAAMNRLKVAPCECIVVENAPGGITAAKRAGAFCIAITTTLQEQYLKDADAIVKNHAELCKYLENKLQLK